MTKAEFIEALGDLNEDIPVSFMRAKIGQTLPYAVYRFPGSDNLMADNQVYHPITSVSLELVTMLTDTASAEIVEDWLDSLPLPWQVVESELKDGEKTVIIRTYDTEVI